MIEYAKKNLLQGLTEMAKSNDPLKSKIKIGIQEVSLSNLEEIVSTYEDQIPDDSCLRTLLNPSNIEPEDFVELMSDSLVELYTLD